MLFKIHGERFVDNIKALFTYDNETNTITNSDGIVYEFPKDSNNVTQDHKLATVFSKDKPLKKSNQVKTIKIQLGLSCNYACDYCSQRFVSRPKETSKKDIEVFISKLSNLQLLDEPGAKIEFWGGEPLVYWKTLRPLVDALDKKFANYVNKPQYSMITNGSLLNEEICDWLFEHNFSIAISHDGPGQYVRGPDPFDDPKTKDIILKFYRRMKKANRGFSFNAMLNVNNMSRKQIQEWFIDTVGDFSVTIGEGGIIDAYDESGQANALQTKADHFKFRQIGFKDVFENESDNGFSVVGMKVNNFRNAVLSHKPASAVAQKCGMDQEDIIAIDLRGDVITCQNTSTTEISGNGNPHRAGSLDDILAVEIKTATHWRNRPHCSECPVVHICQGACMYLEGENWHTSCANAYSDSIVFFALAFESITGFVPVFIENDHLPDERKDIFGTILEHKEVKKPFPIKIVSEPKQSKIIVEGVEVYTKAQ